MDRQFYDLDKYRLDCDWSLYILRPDRKCLRMDFYIFDWCMLPVVDIHCWLHIPVGNLAVHQQNPVDMSTLADRQLRDKYYGFRMG